MASGFESAKMRRLRTSSHRVKARMVGKPCGGARARCGAPNPVARRSHVAWQQCAEMYFYLERELSYACVSEQNLCGDLCI